MGRALACRDGRDAAPYPSRSHSNRCGISQALRNWVRCLRVPPPRQGIGKAGWASHQRSRYGRGSVPRGRACVRRSARCRVLRSRGRPQGSQERLVTNACLVTGPNGEGGPGTPARSAPRSRLRRPSRRVRSQLDSATSAKYRSRPAGATTRTRPPRGPTVYPWGAPRGTKTNEPGSPTNVSAPQRTSYWPSKT